MVGNNDNINKNKFDHTTPTLNAAQPADKNRQTQNTRANKTKYRIQRQNRKKNLLFVIDNLNLELQKAQHNKQSHEHSLLDIEKEIKWLKGLFEAFDNPEGQKENIISHLAGLNKHEQESKEALQSTQSAIDERNHELKIIKKLFEPNKMLQQLQHEHNNLKEELLGLNMEQKDIKVELKQAIENQHTVNKTLQGLASQKKKVIAALEQLQRLAVKDKRGEGEQKKELRKLDELQKKLIKERQTNRVLLKKLHLIKLTTSLKQKESVAKENKVYTAVQANTVKKETKPEILKQELQTAYTKQKALLDEKKQLANEREELQRALKVAKTIHVSDGPLITTYEQKLKQISYAQNVNHKARNLVHKNIERVNAKKREVEQELQRIALLKTVEQQVTGLTPKVKEKTVNKLINPKNIKGKKPRSVDSLAVQQQKQAVKRAKLAVDESKQKLPVDENKQTPHELTGKLLLEFQLAEANTKLSVIAKENEEIQKELTNVENQNQKHAREVKRTLNQRLAQNLKKKKDTEFAVNWLTNKLDKTAKEENWNKKRTVQASTAVAQTKKPVVQASITVAQTKKPVVQASTPVVLTDELINQYQVQIAIKRKKYEAKLNKESLAKIKKDKVNTTTKRTYSTGNSLTSKFTKTIIPNIPELIITKSSQKLHRAKYFTRTKKTVYSYYQANSKEHYKKLGNQPRTLNNSIRLQFKDLTTQNLINKNLTRNIDINKLNTWDKQRVSTYDKLFYYYTVKTPVSLYAHKAFIIIEMQLNASLVRMRLVPYLFLVNELCFYRIIRVNNAMISSPYYILSLYDNVNLPVALHNYMYYRNYRVQFYPKLLAKFFKQYWLHFSNWTQNKVWLLTNFLVSNITAEAVVFDYPNIVSYISPFKRFTNLFYRNQQYTELTKSEEQYITVAYSHTIIKLKLFSYAVYYK